ncbi:hypothetical protein BTM36_09185 [Herbaspirillum sp. VT-16-41]|nr:hypothetical protein BTM36_09185 [Herbaspirillum sp. VT-16-41]
MQTWELMSNVDPREGDPPREFYVTSMQLQELRRLAGVSTRELEERRRANPKAGYQRAHEPDRSAKIARYISYGYPLSSQKGLDPQKETDFIHPGWLPTAILINLIPENDQRRRQGKDLAVDADKAIYIESKGDAVFLSYPDPSDLGPDPWKSSLQPIEVIDGQHRLYAVDLIEDVLGNYEVPVVIYNGLSQALQAYLFWVINVEPKKINPSLAFDLYPELRRQSWLEQGEGIKVYQEHRAQELTEILWRHPLSPWQGRIELHGARVEGHVSNAAFIRTLMASFVRRWNTREDKIGGLFGSVVDKSTDSTERVLPWKRAQQAAFLIYAWQKLHEGVKHSTALWARSCRANASPQMDLVKSHNLDLAFAGPYSLIATDQGARALMVALNAMFFVKYSDLELEAWEKPFSTDVILDEEVTTAIRELEANKAINSFLEGIAASLFYSETFDWRTSSEPSLEKDLERKTTQSAYRGSSGYTLLQKKVIELLSGASKPDVANAAREVKARMGI